MFGLRASFIRADDFDFTWFFGVKIELAVLFVDPSEFIVGLVDLFGIPDEVVAVGLNEVRIDDGFGFELIAFVIDLEALIVLIVPFDA